MLKIRLRRMGSRHRPFYRVVVSDSHRTPTASALEEVGYYDPRREPSVVSIDHERVQFWKGHGAQLSDSVQKLLKYPAPSAPQAVKAPSVAPAPAPAPVLPAEPPANSAAPETTAAPANAVAPENAAAPESTAAPDDTAAPESATAADEPTSEAASA